MFAIYKLVLIAAMGHVFEYRLLQIALFKDGRLCSGRYSWDWVPRRREDRSKGRIPMRFKGPSPWIFLSLLLVVSRTRPREEIIQGQL